MAIILPTLAVFFAAFCVWLTVRIINRKERWAKWTLAAVVGLPVLYVLSFGPACWLNQRGHLSSWGMRVSYCLIFALEVNRCLPEPLDWYARVGAKSGAVARVENGNIVWRKYFTPSPTWRRRRGR
jgi:hypothetical protein